jgi:integrase/recombinase XerD
MFERLFPRRETGLRHITSPLALERSDYLQHCADQGYSPATLRHLATDLLLIQSLLCLHESSQKVDPSAVEAVTANWAEREPKYFSSKNGRRGRENLPHRAIRWLLFMDRLQPAPAAPRPYDALLQDFTDNMRHERGLSEASINGRRWIAEDFLQWFFRGHLSLADITNGEIDEAIARKRVDNLSAGLHTWRGSQQSQGDPSRPEREAQRGGHGKRTGVSESPGGMHAKAMPLR